MLRTHFAKTTERISEEVMELAVKRAGEVDTFLDRDNGIGEKRFTRRVERIDERIAKLLLRQRAEIRKAMTSSKK